MAWLLPPGAEGSAPPAPGSPWSPGTGIPPGPAAFACEFRCGRAGAGSSAPGGESFGSACFGSRGGVSALGPHLGPGGRLKYRPGGVRELGKSLPPHCRGVRTATGAGPPLIPCGPEPGPAGPELRHRWGVCWGSARPLPQAAAVDGLGGEIPPSPGVNAIARSQTFLFRAGKDGEGVAVSQTTFEQCLSSVLTACLGGS